MPSRLGIRLAWAAIAFVLITVAVIFTPRGCFPVVGRKDGLKDACMAYISQLEQALKQYQLDHGDYPLSGADGLALLYKVRSPRGWIYFEFRSAQVIKGTIVDMWGRPLVYRNNLSDHEKGYVNPFAQNKLGVDIYSFGPNGIDEGGAGDDINNWD